MRCRAAQASFRVSNPSPFLVITTFVSRLTTMVRTRSMSVADHTSQPPPLPGGERGRGQANATAGSGAENQFKSLKTCLINAGTGADPGGAGHIRT